MIRSKAFLAAESVIRDATTNQVTLVNVLEQFYSSGYPLLVPRFTVFALLQRDKTDTEKPPLSLRISVGGKRIFGRPVEMSFQGQLITRVVLQFPGMAIPQPGTMILSLHSTSRRLARYDLDVFPAGTPPPKALS